MKPLQDLVPSCNKFGALTDWDPNLVDPCTWFHVVCDGDNRVIRLDLGRLNLSGPLAPELGQLDQLQYMEIFGNNISGPIPSEFGSLANLISLDLSSNSISGAIPAALGNAKRLDHNLLTGLIPRELARLPNLGIVHALTFFFFFFFCASAEISPTTTFVARSRQTEHSRTFPVAGSPSFLHKFMMFRVLPCNIQSRRPWRHRYTVPTLPPSMRRSSLVSRGLNGAAVDADAMRMVTHTFDEVRAAVAAMGSAADVE
ncbi:Leucine-rich repeat protein 1 [Zea mays]|uniref:Leucine-rich repeat protein 1 n=1 Tax=Zea mays TaxID=4577 RepID=A0A3L6EZH0_MAIZE|nr:Leucine-rich repeat protein 1 [Zea mays]